MQLKKEQQTMPLKPPKEDKSPLEALRQAIAEGDADLAAGLFRTYEAGDLVREMRRFLAETEAKP
jgi:hypothetical protein